MLNNNKSLQLNREERRRQERLARKERTRTKVVVCNHNDDFVPLMDLTPLRITTQGCIVELEDGRNKKAITLHCGRCDFDRAIYIINTLDDFVERNKPIIERAKIDTKRNDYFVEFFDYVFINMGDINDDVFEKMIDDVIASTLKFQFKGIKKKGEC
jgi:hypothetical protein